MAWEDELNLEGYETDLEGYEPDLEGYEPDLEGEYSAEDELEDMILGRWRPRSRRYHSRRYRPTYRRNYRRMLPSHKTFAMASKAQHGHIPGVPPIGPKRVIMGLGTVSLSADGAFELTARPQLTVKPVRLVISVTSSKGSASGAFTVVNDLQVGTRSQFASAGNVPSEAFAVTAFDAALVGDQAEPGIDITLQGSVSGIDTGASEIIRIAAAIFCDSIS